MHSTLAPTAHQAKTGLINKPLSLNMKIILTPIPVVGELKRIQLKIIKGITQLI
jgi:hypothetical protein